MNAMVFPGASARCALARRMWGGSTNCLESWDCFRGGCLMCMPFAARDA